MKNQLKKLVVALLVLGGVSLSAPAQARSYVQFGYYGGGGSCASKVVFKGYTRCGCPRYAQRYVRYHDRHGCPVWGYRFLPVRHKCRPYGRPCRPHC